MEYLKSIPGLDITKGIGQHSGNQENYLKVIRSFMVSTKSKLEIIENSPEKNLKQYEITIHGIKGSSRGISAEDIGNKAAELEKAAEAGNIEFINKNNPVFLQDLKALLDDLEDLFNEIDSKIVKQKKERPDEKVLARLASACEIYDMMEVEAAIKELSKYEYETDNDLADWLRHCSEAMEYDKISEKLKQLVN